MSNNHEYPRHAFADLVFVEAWHDGFSAGGDRADLCVDVTFRKEVPVGGEPEAPVRFRLSLKRAEVIVIIENEQYIGVDRNSVARSLPEGDGKQANTITTQRQKSADGDIGVGLPWNASAKAKVSGELKTTRNETIEYNQSIKKMRVVHSPHPRGHSWEVKPSIEEVLDGKPWGAVENPRMKIVDKRTSKDNKIEIYVEIRCRREDFVITNIELKEGVRPDKSYFPRRDRNREKAVEGYIKYRFENSGLDVEVGDIEEKFRNLILSQTRAASNA